ncbi:MAG: hypothetical protein M0R48_06105 [Candidatus Omnitrophica bacterium]|nr:hypothetical protein [Candidatus Omnitrophota bacterium]
MSIIYEALKKVETNTGGNIPKANHMPSGINNSPPKSSKKMNLTFYALIAICTISTILIVVGTYFSSRNLRLQTVKSYLDKQEIGKNKNETYQPAKADIIQVRAETPEVKSISPTADSPALNNAPGLPVYSLQGIVYDENSPFAIINGKTLRKSDAIGDFIVIDIAPTVVTLKNLKDDKDLALSF